MRRYNPVDHVAPWYRPHPDPIDNVGGRSDLAWLQDNYRAWLAASGLRGSPQLLRAFYAGYLATNRRHLHREAARRDRRA